MLPEALAGMFKSWGLSGYENAAVLALLSLMALMSFNLAAGITFKHWSRALRAIGACIYAVGLGIYGFARRLGAPRALTRMENTVSKTKEKSRKEPTLSSAPASEKKKPVRLKIPRQRLLPLPVGKGTATVAINILTLTC